MSVIIRNTQADDFSGIREVCLAVYPESPPWREDQIQSHLKEFPEGQFVAWDTETKKIVGMASSLIVFWDDYNMGTNWKDFTDHGLFTNHDPSKGRTLYGADVMLHPNFQGKGIGKMLYAEREKLTRRLQLLRIRAGARLRGYSEYAATLSPEDYVIKIVRGELSDPTLSFQLKRGFQVLAVVSNYLRNDPESLGYAAVIEWLNLDIAKPGDYQKRDPRFVSQTKHLSKKSECDEN